MIKADPLSKLLTITGFLFALFLSTFDLTVLVLFPVILLTSGIILQYYIFKEPSHHPERHTSVESAGNIGFYTLIGAATLFVLGAVTPVAAQLPFLVGVQLTLTQVVLFASLIAIAEEQFFRGFITNFLARFSVFFAVFGSAVIFAAFHLAVYGTQPVALFYVLGAGLLLAWIGIRSGRLSTVMLIHVINNIGVYILSGVGST